MIEFLVPLSIIWIAFLMVLGVIFLEALLGFPFGFVHTCWMPLPPFLKRVSFDGKHWYGLNKNFKFIWKQQLEELKKK